MSPQKNKYQAYSIATRTVAKTRQIVMLYDGTIRFLKQAQQAAAEKRIEDRFNLLKRASDVILGLQSSLDFENGGEVAQVLHKFYTNISLRILSVNLHPKEAGVLIDGITGEIKQMRDIWVSIDAGTTDTSGPTTTTMLPSGSVVSSASGNVTLSA